MPGEPTPGPLLLCPSVLATIIALWLFPQAQRICLCGSFILLFPPRESLGRPLKGRGSEESWGRDRPSWHTWTPPPAPYMGQLLPIWQTWGGGMAPEPPLTLQEPVGSWAHLSRPFTGKRNHRRWLRWPRSLFSLNPRKEKWPRLYILMEKTVCR